MRWESAAPGDALSQRMESNLGITMTATIRRIEILVLGVCILAFAVVTIPAILRAGDDAKDLGCRHRLRAIGEAFLRYETATGGLPPRRTGFNDGNPYGGWGCQILPYLGLGPDGDRYDLGYDFFDPKNREVVEAWAPAFVCPASPPGRVVQIQSQATTKSLNGDKDTVHSCKAAPTDFIASNGYLAGGVGFMATAFGRDSGIGNQRQPLADNARSPTAAITDGLSRTLLLIEQAGRPSVWRHQTERPGDGQFGISPNARGAWAGWGSIAFGPANAETGDTPGKGDGTDCTVNCNNWHGIYGFHEGGAHVLFCDGSVRFIGLDLDPLTFAYLTIRNDGHLICEDAFRGK